MPTGNADPKELTASVPDYGNTWPASLAKYDPITRSWKTLQCLLWEDSTELLGTWPKWGFALHGECFPLPMLEHDTSANASGSWPTPTKWNKRGVVVDTYNRVKAGITSRKSGAQIGSALNWFPPAVENWTVAGMLNPELMERLMLWPIGWTALHVPATDRFRQWLRSHGACSEGR